METMSVRTDRRIAMVDITPQVAEVVSRRGWRSGILTLFVPHTTAGITINEGADPALPRDIQTTLARLVPRSGDYEHCEDNADAHIKASLLGSSAQVIVEEGAIRLGTWQAIFLFEGDGPRTREVWLQWSGG